MLIAVATSYIYIYLAETPPEVSAPEASQEQPIEYVYRPTDPEGVFEAVQDWRESQGLPRYTRSEDLCYYARKRDEVVERNYDLYGLDGAHNGFDALSSEVFSNTGFNHLAENLSDLAPYDNTPEEALRGWLDSPPHRQTILAPYTHSCVSCHANTCVQLFARY